MRLPSLLFLLSLGMMTLHDAGFVLADAGSIDEVETYNRGIQKYDRGQWAEAGEMFARVSASTDSSLAAKARYNHGNSYYAQAVQAIRNQSESDPPVGSESEPGPTLEKAEIVEKLRSAIVHYRSGLRLDPSDDDARADIESAARLIQMLQQPDPPKSDSQPSDDQPSDDQPSDDQPSGDQPSGDQPSGDQSSGDQSSKGESTKESESSPQQSDEPTQSESEGSTEQSDDAKPQDSPERSSERSSENEPSESAQPSDEDPSQSQQESAGENQSDQSSESPPAKTPSSSSPSDASPGQNEEPGDAPNDQSEADENQTGDESRSEQGGTKRGELTTSDQADKDEDGTPVGIAGDGDQASEMTIQEARKMLQAIRDRDMLRRFRQREEARHRRIPVDRDW